MTVDVGDRCGVVVVSLLAVLSALIGVAAAGAAWRSSMYVSGRATRVVEARVAVNASGDAAVAWLAGSGDQLRARARSLTDGRPGAIFDLSAAGQVARFPEVAVAVNGTMVFTWMIRRGLGATGLQARARAPGGDLGPVVDIATAVTTSRPSSVAVDANGNAVVAWTTGRGDATEVFARSWSAVGELGAITSVSGAGLQAHDPQVAIAANGNGLIVWTALGSDGKSRARSRSWSSSPAVAPGPVFVASRGPDGGSDAQVAMNSSGDAVLAWVAPDGDRSQQYLHARLRSATGRLGPDRTLRVGDTHATIATAGNGSAFFAAYNQLDPDYPIRAQTLTARGRVTPARILQTGDHTVRASASQQTPKAMPFWSGAGTSGMTRAWSRDRSRRPACWARRPNFHRPALTRVPHAWP